MAKNASSSSSRSSRNIMPSSSGIIRLSESECEKLLPAEMLATWKIMSAKEKREVRKILGNTEYLKRECHKFETQKSIYREQISSFEGQVAMLKEDITDMNDKIEVNETINSTLKEKLDENEEELMSFKIEVTKHLKMQREADALKADIEDTEKELKLTRRQIVKTQKTLVARAAHEKEVIAAYGEKVQQLKELRDLIVEQGLFSPQKIEQLNEDITEYQFNLAFYENDDEAIKKFNEEFEEEFYKK